MLPIEIGTRGGHYLRSGDQKKLREEGPPDRRLGWYLSEVVTSLVVLLCPTESNHVKVL